MLNSILALSFDTNSTVKLSGMRAGRTLAKEVPLVLIAVRG
jgi:hypothetical protein